MKAEAWPSPHEQFLQYTQEVIGDYLKDKIDRAKDTDSIFGEISGVVKTVPTSSFKILFDTNKNELESTVQHLLMEKFKDMKIDSDTKFESLNADVFTANESENGKPVGEREAAGGYRSLI